MRRASQIVSRIRSTKCNGKCKREGGSKEGARRTIIAARCVIMRRSAANETVPTVQNPLPEYPSESSIFKYVQISGMRTMTQACVNASSVICAMRFRFKSILRRPEP